MFEAIWVSGIRRGIWMENLAVPFKVIVSLFQSFFLIRRFKPDIAVGTGGYVCGPVLYAASMLGIPVIVHESNSYPGLTTRLLSQRATKVFTAFDATGRWLKRSDNIELVGTPTSAKLGKPARDEARRFFGLNANNKTVLVFGGSLGAASLNDAIIRMVTKLKDARVQLIWQTGEQDFEKVRRSVTDPAIGWVAPFIENMEDAYAAADVVLCRSGATTIAELTRIGKPAVLVPYPRAAADHQTFNARELVNQGAAVMVADNELEKKLPEVLLGLLEDDPRRESMAKASKQLGRPNAGRLIAEKILSLIEESTVGGLVERKA